MFFLGLLLSLNIQIVLVPIFQLFQMQFHLVHPRLIQTKSIVNLFIELRTELYLADLNHPLVLQSFL